MDRSTRTLVVVAIAVALASASTYLVYRTIQNRPARVVEVAESHAVVAAHPIPLGTRLTAADLKLVAWPAANKVPGGFEKIEDVVDRGVVASVAENEPLTANNIASKDAGAGLPPTIPPGMRALSVKVNEVVGVAGFVLPSTRVDVMVILKEQSQSVARVVVSNVLVLAAGTKFDQAIGREGQAVPSSVVTLMLSPDDAERVALAANEGSLMLTLRNPLDTAQTVSPGMRTSSLMGDAPVAPVVSTGPRKARPAATVTPPPPPPPPPTPRAVAVIKQGQRTDQIIKRDGGGIQ